MVKYSPSVSNNPEEVVFSIIIPTWNNLEYLKNCIRSIRANSTYRHQIVLHINEGKDGTEEWAQNEGIDFSISKENLGVCQACNSAYHLTTADHILFLNDDMYVLPEWDKALKEEVDAMPHNDFYISATLVEPHLSGNNCVLSPYDFGDTLETFKEEELKEAAKTLSKNDWNGSTWPPSLMHRQLWDRIGGYSIEFMPGYYSDPDLSAKMWFAGVREFKGVGRSLVYHFMSKSTNRFTKKPGYKTFVKKWGMTARFFTRNFLKIGSDYTGQLPDYNDKKAIKKERIRSSIKLFV